MFSRISHNLKLRTEQKCQIVAWKYTSCDPLSDRELEVLLKIGEGHTNREIADELFVGVSTVKKHITHIYSKLQVADRLQAIIRARDAGLS